MVLLMIPIEIIRLNGDDKRGVIYHIHGTSVYYIDSENFFHSISINDLSKEWKFVALINMNGGSED